MNRHRYRCIQASLLLALGIGPASAAYRDLSPSSPVARQIASPASIEPRWEQPMPASTGLASLAAWEDGAGGLHVYASDTANGSLLVLDGATGTALAEGNSPRLAAPTALFVIDDVLFVVEQDERRVLALGLPDLRPLGTVGDGGLIRPTSLFARHTDVDSYLLYVADDYDNDGRVPPDRDLNRRIKTYQVTLGRDDGVGGQPQGIAAERVGQLGETEGDGILRRVGAMAGDPFYDHLLIAERDTANDSGLRVYGFAGKYRNARLDRGLFRQRATGVALRACDNGRGHWFASDDADGSPVLLMDRASLRPAGAFRPAGATADALWYQENAGSSFPSGVLLVRQGGAISAFDWRDIAREPGLDSACR